ncbi:glycosyltransferase family 2 protein [Pasteurella canis]|uniref:glycosyltransferase family 2 protein n=1 Tax=Pasteurella canis TaxID=753 RepID=UPI001E325ADB|nr:glycosyltransferase family 2 protein [Pasteurella canis]UEA16880.1 glycosyltransferase family 2 protein [Pasteurella canis]
MDKVSMPLVSVLICAYNVDKYIEECIDAILNQTYKKLEIIIVNDGSVDDTLLLLNNFAKRDSRIKIINNEKNIGFIGSLNVGVSHVSGDYVARTDADDVTKPEWIEKILDSMRSNPDIIAMGSYITVLSEDGNGSHLANYYEHNQEWQNPLTHCEIIEEMLFRNPIHNNSMIIRSSAFSKYGLRFDSSYKYAEDYKFWLEVSRLGKLANYPESLVYYRLHNTQTSSVHNIQQNLIAKKIRKIAINYYLQDLGVNYILGDKISFNDLVKIQSELFKLDLLKKEVIIRVLYDCYLSLFESNIKYVFCFLYNKNNSIFTRKQKIKIIKRMLRPNKYKPIL